MVSFRTLVVTFGLFCGVFGQSNGTTTTSAPATSSSAVVVSAATIDDISNSTVVDPSDVEDLFSGLVGVSNSTNSTLVVERSNTNCKCSYGMSCWPADVAWDLLNLTLSGRLIKYIPAAAPCHNTFNGLNTYNADQCSVVTTGWTTEEFQFQPHSRFELIAVSLIQQVQSGSSGPTCHVNRLPIRRHRVREETIQSTSSTRPRQDIFKSASSLLDCSTFVSSSKIPATISLESPLDTDLSVSGLINSKTSTSSRNIPDRVDTQGQQFNLGRE